MTTIEDNPNNNLKLCEYRYNQIRSKRGHYNQGCNNPRWNGGKRITSIGYIKILKHGHPLCDIHGYVYEHRLVMEAYLGRYLDPKEVVHHIDKNRQNNSIDNLILFENSGKHSKYEFTIDMSDRRCLSCKSDKTINRKNERPNWYKYENSYLCQKCYYKNRRKK